MRLLTSARPWQGRVSRNRTAGRGKPACTRQLRLQPLENRQMLSVGVVTTSISGYFDQAFDSFVQGDNIVVAGETLPSGSAAQATFAALRYQSDGSLDPYFGSGGVATADIGSWNDAAFAAAPSPDGTKIVLAGLTDSAKGGRISSDSALAQFDAGDGTLDNAFGSGGTVKTSIGQSRTNDWFNDMTIQSDGYIVAAGQSVDASGATRFTLARYTPAGKLDTSFGNGGIVQTTEFSGIATAVVMVHDDLGDGIVAVGRTVGSGGWYFALARYDLGGNLVSGFGDGGIVTSDFTDSGRTDLGADWAEAATVDPVTGDIVVVGRVALEGSTAPSDWAVARYHSDGTPVSDFGQGGLAHVDVNDEQMAEAVAIQAGGKIVSAGYSWAPGTMTYAFTVVRFNADGTPDQSFGTGGVAQTRIGSYAAEAQSVVIQQDDKIVLTGWANTANGKEIALARYNPDGTLDASFGPANNPPTANDDSRTTDMDVPVTIDVLAKCS